MTLRLPQALFAALSSAVLLAGCGQAGVPTALMAGQLNAGLAAQSTLGLQAGFNEIFQAAFEKLDANQDGFIDEYEAGPMLSLGDFQKADKNGDHKLSEAEFMNYAVGNGFFGFFRQSAKSFEEDTREALWGAFQKLDTNHDGLLESNELSDAALKKVNIHLTVSSLRINVVLTSLDQDLFDQHDKTGDGKLSQAEFEDYCMAGFLKGINAAFAPSGPAPAPNNPPAPAGNTY